MDTTIILAASTHQIDAIYTNQIMPIRGKPAIAWVIENNKSKKDTILVLSKDNLQTIEYIQKRYPEVKLALIDAEKEEKKVTGFSILDSLSCAMELVSLDTKVCKVVLGDTLCRDIPQNSKDFVLVSDDFASPQRWCLVESDEKGQIKQLFDKQSNIEIENKKVLVGYYQFTNIPLLQKLLSEIIYAQKTQLSDLLAQYNRQQAIYCFETKAWFDFGHKAGLIKAQNYFYNSRDFNSLKSNPILGTITKASANCQKLEDEYFWYNDLPEGLKILAPRTFGFKKKDAVAELEMEMYGYPALSELLILGHLSVEEWQLIIRRLFEVHKVCEKYEGQLSESNFYNLYITKTQKRLEMLKKQGAFWETLLAYDTLKINGVEYKNINFFEEKLKAKLEELVKTVKVSVMHGDYCFSNILFDTNSFICRLIDPRGRLEERTIYGDARYDIAKLRHSVVGGYDFAVHGLFKLTQEGNSFEVSNNYPDFQEELTAFFDKATVEFGYDLSQIKLIEAILFLSMIPLHKDNLDRQKNSRFVEIEHGYVIFAVLYILNLCDEKQKEDLLKNDEISKLYRGMENAK